MNGVINVLKPPGMTSHDVVSFIRKVSGIKKVGHTGTLDPGAAGVLPVCIGKATKVVDYIMNDRKTYICELTLGNATDTYDKYGNFLYEVPRDVPDLNEADLLKVLELFRGEIIQKPPIFSAIRINGRRAYDLARQGQDVDIPTRKVTIYDINIINIESRRVMLKIECSKGTYIRSICNDIGTELGCLAYMSFLIRTGTGKFTLENSYIMDELNKENIEGLLAPPDFCLSMDSFYVPMEYKNKLLNGNSIVLAKDGIANGQYVRIYLENNEFIGIGKYQNNILQVEKLLL